MKFIFGDLKLDNSKWTTLNRKNYFRQHWHTFSVLFFLINNVVFK